ncbi:hypothetical protein KCP75_10815 [Salmonella enterica subsp. enterica]|nr:hypothetical protein KCP75_10815 [Salmonella enterica subsp. enterica]
MDCRSVASQSTSKCHRYLNPFSHDNPVLRHPAENYRRGSDRARITGPDTGDDQFCRAAGVVIRGWSPD